MELRSYLLVQKISTNPNSIRGIFELHNGPMIPGLRGQQFESLIFQKLRLSCKSQDNCVVIHDGSVILISNFVENREDQIWGREEQNSSHLKHHPPKMAWVRFF
jgi:hypothetical protein